MAWSDKRSKTLVLGMGNTLVTDDGVGIHIVRELARQLPDGLRSSVDVEETCESYFALLDYYEHYDRIILVDAILGAEKDIGQLRHIDLEQWERQRPLSLLHNSGPATIVQMLRSVPGMPSPDVHALGVVISKDHRFGQNMSDSVAQAVGTATRQLLIMLTQPSPVA